MLTLTNGYQRWLVSQATELAEVVFFAKIKKAAIDFLQYKKLATKAFTTLDIYGTALGYSSSEVRKLYRVLIVNLRKKHSILKNQVTEYEIPFITHHNRSNRITLNINGSSRPVLITRYLRYIGVYSYIQDKGLDMRIDVEEEVVDGAPTITRITLSFSTSNISAYLSVFIIPEILKVASTLHRKAIFVVNPVISPSSDKVDEVEDPNIIPYSLSVEDILGEF